MRYVLIMIIAPLLICCSENKIKTSEAALTTLDDTSTMHDASLTTGKKIDQQHAVYKTGELIKTGRIMPEQLVAYATTLIGIPYKYGSIDPSAGFDCSGFITHVFNHFNITVPRSSVDFTNIPIEVSLQEAKPGDLILFTGTDSTNRTVGHMGIITSAGSDISFIHSTSGKANGVTITTLKPHYMGRFVKIVRVFNE